MYSAETSVIKNQVKSHSIPGEKTPETQRGRSLKSGRKRVVGGSSNGTKYLHMASAQLRIVTANVIIDNCTYSHCSYRYSYRCSYRTYRHQYEINFIKPSASLDQVSSRTQKRGNDYNFIRVSDRVEQLLKPILRSCVSISLCVRRKKP